ncbi:MAG: UvrD-helicase domain-containing protein [Clostridia bacterium]|nr:UvrD-helicase domain-containing protein [Clostridia bacterium]
MDLSKLNPPQREAVTATEGPLLILAGAGSGKTRVLTHRIAYLIEEKGVSPYRILALTFTNKAAKEMRERVDALVETDANSIWVATFHGFCARLLSMEIDRLGYGKSFIIYDEQDQQSLIGHIIKDMNLNDKVFTKRMLAGIFSHAKNHSLSPLAFLRETGQPTQILEAFKLYEKRLKDANALDFDDLLLCTIRLFEENPDVLEKWQQRFRYILVDEYQDTNLAQYHIVNLLAKVHRNLCVVGDDDQSIYAWRGADIRNILEFEKDFEGCKVIRLEQNYRSTEKILDAANAVIHNNRGRKEKKLWTAEKGGAPIDVHEATDERDEAYYICSKISNAVRNGARYDDFAILYRTHAQTRVLEMMLKSFLTPYRIYGGLSFFSRAEVKDILAYLRLILNPADDEAFLRVINTPPRGIGAQSIAVLSDSAHRRGIPLMSAGIAPDDVPPRTAAKFTPFLNLFQKLYELLDTMPLADFARELLERIGYDAYLKDDKKENYEVRAEVVEELLGYIEEFEQSYTESDGNVLQAFLTNVALFSQADNVDETNGCVNLMTLHAAKGLEFPNVFLCGMEEGLFPSSQSSYDEDKLEEERRLCYVGMTRAKKRLYLSYAKERMLYGRTEPALPSRFLTEMGDTIELPGARPQRRPAQQSRWDSTSASSFFAAPIAKKPKEPVRIDVGTKPEPPKKAANFAGKVGDRVRHKAFGDGVIIGTSGSGASMIVQIQFDNGAVKKLAAGFAPLEILE